MLPNALGQSKRGEAMIAVAATRQSQALNGSKRLLGRLVIGCFLVGYVQAASDGQTLAVSRQRRPAFRKRAARRRTGAPGTRTAIRKAAR
jgi:hypothetical protein